MSGTSHSARRQSRKHRRHAPAAASADSWELRFRTAVDWSLGAAFVLIPISMGFLTALRYFTLALVAAIAGVSCALWQMVRTRGRWNRSGAEWILAAGVVLLVAQIAPLPIEWMRSLSPRLADLLPAWTSGAEGSLGQWTTLSLNPVATLRGLTSFLACGVLFLVAMQRIETQDDAERALKWVGGAAVGMAVFGLIQYFTSNGLFFWVYEHPQTNTSEHVKGAFSNRNHFANFLALGIGPLLFWALARSRSADDGRGHRSGMTTSPWGGDAGPIWVGACVVILAVILSLSRGGFIALTAAIIVCVAVHVRAGLISGRVAMALSGCAVAIGIALALFGFQQIEDRLSTLASGDVEQLDELDGRRTIWAANWKALNEYPAVGLGVGAHRDVYRRFIEGYYPREFAYAESSLFQLGLESGATGLGLVALGIALIVFHAVRSTLRSSSTRVVAAQAAVLAGISAGLLHAVVDFVWHMPACMILLIALAACAIRIDQIDRDHHLGRSADDATPAPWPLRAFVVLGSAVLGVWLVDTKVPALLAEPYANQYFLLTRATETEGESAALSRQRVETLVEAVKADPQDGRLHLRLALECVLHFADLQALSENSMFLPQLRDAAMASEFETAEDLRAWVQRAAGPNVRLLDGALQHARRAVELIPLQARGYLVLAELCFLDGNSVGARRAYLTQARIADPNDGFTLIASGQQHWMDEEHAEAIALWKQAFHQNPYCRRQILDDLAGAVDASFFLEHFEPAWDDLRVLRLRYDDGTRPVDLAAILKRQVVLAEERAEATTGRESTEALRIAADAYFRLGKFNHTRQCLTRANEADPNDYDVRLMLGEFHYEQQEFPEAAGHLQWCVRRRPRNARARWLAEDSLKRTLRNTALSTTPTTAASLAGHGSSFSGEPLLLPSSEVVPAGFEEPAAEPNGEPEAMVPEVESPHR